MACKVLWRVLVSVVISAKQSRSSLVCVEREKFPHGTISKWDTHIMSCETCVAVQFHLSILVSHAVGRSNTHLVLAVRRRLVAYPVTRVADFPIIVLCQEWHNARIDRSPDAKLMSILKAWRVRRRVGLTQQATPLIYMRGKKPIDLQRSTVVVCVSLHVDVPPNRVLGTTTSSVMSPMSRPPGYWDLQILMSCGLLSNT